MTALIYCYHNASLFAESGRIPDYGSCGVLGDCPADAPMICGTDQVSYNLCVYKVKKCIARQTGAAFPNIASRGECAHSEDVLMLDPDERVSIGTRPRLLLICTN